MHAVSIARVHRVAISVPRLRSLWSPGANVGEVGVISTWRSLCGPSLRERNSLIADLVVLGATFERCKSWQIIVRTAVGAAKSRHRRLCRKGRHGLRLAFAIVVVLAAHFGVFSNPILARLSADNGSAHEEGHDSPNGNHNSRRKNKVGAKGLVRDEKENIDNEGGNRDQEIDEDEDKEHEEKPRRV